MELKEENKKRQIELAAKKLKLKQEELKHQREFNQMMLEQMKMFDRTKTEINNIGTTFDSDSN